MSTLDREIAGLSCRAVLHRLSPYLDGELPVEERQQVEAHLAACETCARFGGHVGALVRQLRTTLEFGPVVSPLVTDHRLAAVLAKVQHRSA